MLQTPHFADRAWVLVVLLWLAALGKLVLRSVFPESHSLGAPMGAALWPLMGLSMLLFVSTLRVLFASTEDTVVGHYAILDSMKMLQRDGATTFFLLPLLGGLSLTLLYPLMLSNVDTPLRAGAQSLLICALYSLFLWEKHRWQRALMLTGAGFLALYLPSFFGASAPTLWSTKWTVKLVQHAVIGLFLLMLVGLCIRWMSGRKTYRRSLQQSATLLMLCVGAGHLLQTLLTSTKTIKYSISLSLFVLGFALWTGLGARSIRAVLRLQSYSHAQAHLHYRPYLFGATLPLALLLALGGWTSYSISPTVLLLLISAQLLSFVSFMTLHSVHNVSLGEPSPIWALLRPVLVFLLLYFPYGAIGLTVLEMWR
ncbi:MAG: hypothetical protein EP343_24215 [Deltaproteobacteria bacterium]|nr:MAG: hypothetical protein EP343_24215 [Deltaproteobacteria bacterium]